MCGERWRASEWNAATMMCVRSQEAQAEEELVWVSVPQTLQENVKLMARKAETRSTCVDDVSNLCSHPHRSKATTPTTATLECKNAY